MGRFVDLTGKKFNKLTVLERVNNKTGNRYKWKCLCDCGNITLVYPQNLKNGHTKSCGCIQLESAFSNVEKAKSSYRKKYIVEGTSIAKIAQDKPNKNNRSGTTGVFFHSQSQKWDARITFQGKRYELGRFKHKEDAIKARKEAEDKYHKNFLEWYHKSYKKK